MFGRKKEQTPDDSPHLKVHTMPALFYGGNDPVVYHHKEVLDQAQKPLGPHENSLKKAATGSGSNPKALIFSNKKLIWIASSVLFFIVASVSAYYIRGYIQAHNALRPLADAIPEKPSILQKTATSSENTEILEKTPISSPTSSENVVATSTPSLSEDVLELELGSQKLNLLFPPISSSQSSDLDKDQLTDIEEEIFGTDSGSWDSDADSYYDGQEVFNLYNPKGFAPVRLIDSGLIKQYINPIFDYRLYYPKDWQVGEVDQSGKQVLFSAVSGDYIEVQAIKESKLDFMAWFKQYAVNQKSSDLLQFTNRFEVEGWKRRDSLVAYFPSKGMVYVLIYHPGNAGPAVFKNTMNMVLQSFRPVSTGKELPADLLPQPGFVSESSTTTSSNTSTSSLPTAATTSSSNSTSTLSEDTLELE